MIIFPGCTILGVKGRDGRALLGSNSDNPWDTRTRLVVVRGTGPHRIIGTELLSPDKGVPWAGMLTRGQNDAGLGFVFAYVQPIDTDYTTADGVTFAEMPRYVLGRCETVDQAEEELRGMKRAFHGNFIFADRQEGLKLFEISVNNLETIPIKSNWICCNHYVSNNMLNINDAEYIKSVNSKERYAAAYETFNELTRDGKDGQELIGGVLTSHKSRLEEETAWGHSPCNHGAVCGTVSSEILDPANDTFSYCFGWACSDRPNSPDQLYQSDSWGKYVPYVLEKQTEGVLFERK